MIKNIVFDMGKVLLDYDPVKVCRQFTDREEDIALIGKELFFSEEWVMLDRGDITEEEAIKRVQSRLPDERLRTLAAESLAHWYEYNISPKPGMRELVTALKERGCRIYLCSNASLRLREFQDQIPGIEYFDGILVSAEERVLKPEPEIFEKLFERYSLRPEESFFIDDLEANIEGARRCGMDGYCFADGDVERLKQYLWEQVL